MEKKKSKEIMMTLGGEPTDMLHGVLLPTLPVDETEIITKEPIEEYPNINLNIH